MSNTMNDSAAEASARPSRHLFWPILLTSLISIHIISVVVMVMVATHDHSFAIEPDWYQKGLHYNQTAQQQQANSRLGWSLRLDVGQPMTGTNRRRVTCTVLDREGKPVENATVDLVAFAHLRGSNLLRSVLLPRDSKYEALIPMEDPGMWEFRFVVTRGRDTFTQIVKREI
jgi:nitrogen fixation protein FixH